MKTVRKRHNAADDSYSHTEQLRNTLQDKGGLA